MKIELENIKKQIDEVELVSFDVFDTLLLRNVLEPTDIFLLMEHTAKKEFQITNFQQERIEAEAASRVGHENSETTLEEIYQELEKKYDKKLNKLLQLELEYEEKFLTANHFMYQVYEYAKKQKKKVIAISDMYLSKEFISKILKQNNYDLDEVYVSSENFQVKGNGTLFESVEKKEKIARDKWLHMGDNYVSDFSIPQKLGINAIHYPKLSSRSKMKNESGFVEESIMKAIIQNKLYTTEKYTDWEVFGISCVAPIYYSYTNWVYQMTKHKDNMYFLARDGYMIKKVYELFAKKLNKNMDLYYLYCSRASYQIPTLQDGDKALALDVLTRYNANLNQKVSVQNILKGIGLDIENYDKQLRNFELKADTILNTSNRYRVQKFLSYIYEDITKELEKKKAIVQKYLAQMNMPKYENVNIVDIGWAGSTQYSLGKLLPNKKITGYYFGTRKSMYDDVKYNSFGYLFDSEEPGDLFEEIDKNVMMYEFIFSAPHGTTLGFEETKEGVEPILGDNSVNNSAIETFQASALDTCREFLKYYDELKNTPPYLGIQNYRKFIQQRNFKDLKMFKNITEAVGFDGDRISFVPTFKKEEVLANPKEFYDLISKSLWKNAYLFDDVEEEEYNQIKEMIFSKKSKVKSIVKNMNVKTVYRAFRYPRTTIRKIKKVIQEKED